MEYAMACLSLLFVSLILALVPTCLLGFAMRASGSFNRLAPNKRHTLMLSSWAIFTLVLIAYFYNNTTLLQG